MHDLDQTFLVRYLLQRLDHLSQDVLQLHRCLIAGQEIGWSPLERRDAKVRGAAGEHPLHVRFELLGRLDQDRGHRSAGDPLGVSGDNHFAERRTVVVDEYRDPRGIERRLRFGELFEQVIVGMAWVGRSHHDRGKQ